MKRTRIAIATGHERMTVVSKTPEGKVKLTQFTWWCDGESWCSRATWRFISWTGKPVTEEMIQRHDNEGLLMMALAFEAGCDVPL